MNWGELKNEIKNLGFEETEALEEYSDIIITSANRALHIIATTAIPVIARYDFTQDGTESGLKRYDISELTGDFLAFTDTPVKVYNDSYDTFNDFEIEEGHILVMDAGDIGDFSVFYKKRPAVITRNTLDTEPLDIDIKIEPALPLLTSYYVWLDDDERKATQYYNMYDMLKTDLLSEQNSRVRGRIIGGI